MSYTVVEGFDELLALGDLDLFLTKTKELCEMKLRSKFFRGMEKEDVVQEVLIKVYQSLDRYDYTKGKASTYVENVVNNHITDCIRKSNTGYMKANTSTHEFVDELDDDMVGTTSDKIILSDQEDKYAYSNYMIDFMDNIGLDDREKQIFKLRCTGYDFVEIAGLLNLTKARISQLWKGIMKKYEGA